MKKILSFLFIPLVLAILSYVVVFPLKDGIIANGESSIYINPQYYNYLSSWEEKINFGQYSSHQSNIVLYIIFWNIFKIFSFVAHPSVIFIYLSYFLSGLFFYLCISKVFSIKNKLIILPAVLLYTFNPFRMIGPINERIHLLFIFMPLFLYFHHRLINSYKWKYVLVIVFLSWLSSSIGANPPLFSIPYFLIILQLIFKLVLDTKNNKKLPLIFQHIVLFILIIMVNFFWIYPAVTNLLATYKDPSIRGNMFLALGSGSFLDHFRLIGSWAWRGGHMGSLYYPFSVFFDQPIILIISILISISILFGYLVFKKPKDKEQASLAYFMMTLFPISLLLLAGVKGPGGILVKLLYEFVPFFLIYREPFAKFTPLFVLSSSVLLTFITSYILKISNKWLSSLLFTFLVLSILVIATPFFTGQVSPDRAWSGGQAGYLVKIPSYWHQAKLAIESDQLDNKLFLSPFTLYGNSHNWSYGVGTANDVSEFLIDKPIIKSWTFDGYDINKIINSVFEYQASESSSLSKYIGFLNSSQVLQMNELDWRYSGGRIKQPSETNRYLLAGGLNLKEDFGLLSKDDIVNSDLDSNPSRRQNLLNELTNKPALSLYQVNREDFVPHIYIPKQIFFTNKSIDLLSSLVSSQEWLPASAVFFFNSTDQLNNIASYFPIESRKNIDDSVFEKTLSKVEIHNRPTLEYKKISETKYRIIVHGASSDFPIIFSENFHSDWKLFIRKHNKPEPVNLDNMTSLSLYDDDYAATNEEIRDFFTKGLLSSENTLEFISKNLHGTIQNNNLANGNFYENWFDSPLSSEYHRKINGFSNLWLINIEEMCYENNCIVNLDKTVDFEFSLEFGKQKTLNLNLFLSGIILSFCIILFLLNIFRESKKSDKKN